MEKKGYSEFGLIDAIRRRFADIPAGGCEGIGDDCAVLPLDSDHSLVVTIDTLVEDVHFLRDKIPPQDLGYKSLAVNLSDVAAMGAAPVASFLSISLPAGLPAEWIDAFMEGYHALSAEHGVPLLGGDTTASPGPVSVSVTAIGRAENRNIKRRSRAKEVDIILVTGLLGSSAKGLLDLRNEVLDSDFIVAHHRPRPRVEEGKWFGNQSGVHAMIDLSDGLASDLKHILKASGVRAEVNIEMIPSIVGVELAVTGGEDYQLLCTVAAEEAEKIRRDFEVRFGEPLHPIGRITAGEPEIVWLENGKKITPDWKGFSHF